MPLPDIDYVEIPVDWWDAEADKSLLIGVFKHGVYFRVPPFLKTPHSYCTSILESRVLLLPSQNLNQRNVESQNYSEC